MKRRTFLGLLSATTANAVSVSASARTSVNRLRPGVKVGSPAADKVRFIAFGDSGKGDGTQYELARLMAAHHGNQAYDTVLLLGDNVYPNGDIKDLPAKFERPYADLLNRGVRFQAVLGNHDVSKGREWQINYRNFNMGGHAYYSFTKGDGLVEFFALDSNNFELRQQQWLDGALAASQARWKIAFFHHPIYSSGNRHGSDLELRARIEPLLVKHGVAAAFAGHDHTYERTKLQQGVQYFVAGTGSRPRRGDLNRRTPIFASGNDENSSFMSVVITPEQFSFKTIDETGRVIDNGELAPLATQRTATLSS